ncbi:sarcosine oxidase subunit delta [Erythrobacter sp. W302b]|uniref:sarcosine oxidase subunit delta n=1 Tax=Erythrobacter sp. W302b TaxID=3389874 RepID=UPI00396AF5E5
MLLIACPHCGPRDEAEFTCGGESHIQRPDLTVGADEWAEYLFQRRNPAGVTFERWRHTYGCERWFNVARCTFSHEIKAVYAMTDTKPELP